jgi:REP element-mobilizing transposase RayT
MSRNDVEREGIMSNTFTQIYIQAVFAVKGRQCLISHNREFELYSYIGGILKSKGHKPLAINGIPDRIHIFFGMKPIEALSDLIRDIKANSSRFINNQNWLRGKFNWQEGFGAFSYSHSELDRVIRYIKNRKQHHEKRSFKEEYFNLLNEFNMKYDNKYIFDWIE